MIQMIDADTFTTEMRGHKMTLRRKAGGWWEMWTENAATRAWNGKMPGVRVFHTLADVERRYKTWRGVAALLDDNTAA